MRLWHYKLIPSLPRQQLLGQHRECCALRGKGWGKKHSTVNYVFSHNYLYLFHYHCLVMQEMRRRGYKTSSEWSNICYRGKIIGEVSQGNLPNINYIFISRKNIGLNYPEHNEEYYKECIKNLKRKGIEI